MSNATLDTLRTRIQNGTLLALLRDPSLAPDETYSLVAFQYHQDFTISATDTASAPLVPLQIGDDSGFIIYNSMFTCFDSVTGDVITDPNVTVQLQDSGSQQNLSDGPLPVTSIFGTASLPFPWTPPKILRPVSILNASATALTIGANPIDLSLVYAGARIYPA